MGAPAVDPSWWVMASMATKVAAGAVAFHVRMVAP